MTNEPVKYLVILSNEGGELDRRSATNEEEARAAALDLISGLSDMTYGDTIRVVAYP